MMNQNCNFRKNFLSFYEQYCKEKPILDALGSTNSINTKKLLSSFKSIKTYRTLLSRINYLKHTNNIYELEDLLSQFQNISPISLQEAMNFFKRPNEKERYGSLILFLRSNIDLFAQVTYYSLLTSCHIGETDAFTRDSVLYFCFSTFPSLFCDFISKEDQDLGIEYIISILSYHLYIHGPNFTSSHIFISYLISAFFTTMNPNDFFEQSFQPILRDFSGASPKVRYSYSFENKSLIRSEYWHQIINLVNILITNMISRVDLLPISVRRLISAIHNIKCENFPFSDIFVIDSMFLDYLERLQTFADPTLMHDICEVIRCTFPPEFTCISLRSQISNQPFFKTLNLDRLIDAFVLPKEIELISNLNSNDKFEIDPIGASSSQFDKTIFITPRSLSLLHHIFSLFMKLREGQTNDENNDINNNHENNNINNNH